MSLFCHPALPLTPRGQLRARVGTSHRAILMALSWGALAFSWGGEKKAQGLGDRRRKGSQMRSCNMECLCKRAAVFWTASLRAGRLPGPTPGKWKTHGPGRGELPVSTAPIQEPGEFPTPGAGSGFGLCSVCLPGQQVQGPEDCPDTGPQSSARS